MNFGVSETNAENKPRLHFLIRTWGNVWEIIQREPNDYLTPDDIRKDINNHHLFNVELDEDQAEQAEKYIHRLELAHKALSKLLTPDAK